MTRTTTPATPATPATTKPSDDLAARRAEAARAAVAAEADARRLHKLETASAEAARQAEIAALNDEMRRVMTDLREARDAAVKHYDATVRNPKASLLQLAQAHLDRIEAETVIRSERWEINTALDKIDPRYQSRKMTHSGHVERVFVPREPGTRAAWANALIGLDDVIFEWATNVTSNTVFEDAAREREARVYAAREAAREAAIAGATASS